MKEKDIAEIRALYKFSQIKAQQLNKEWYTLRSILGNTWAWFYILIGAREAGKSYAVMEYCIKYYKKTGHHFTWLRLTEPSCKKMLASNALKLVDPDLRRKYDLNLKVRGGDVFDGDRLFCRVLALSTFYNDKGVALYDNENDLGSVVVLDEMNREQTERVTFDINTGFVGQMENLVRSSKDKMKIFLIGNTLQEAGDILCSFGYIPQEFGRYYIHKKRAVIDYMPPSEKYLRRRKGTVADILSPDASAFTNIIDIDASLVRKMRLSHPQYIIKFSNSKRDWFTVWSGNVISGWNGEHAPAEIYMRPYCDGIFTAETRDMVIASYDARAYYYHDLFTQKNFRRQLVLLKPRKTG